MTMAQHAARQRGIIEPSKSQQGHPPAEGLQLLNADMLPPTAKQDPAYQSGMGADLAVNQPSLAAKYGVIRGGNFVPPQLLTQPPSVPSSAPSKKVDVGGPSGVKLRQETVDGMKRLFEAQAGANTPQSTNEDDVEEAQAKAGIAGKAADVGAPPKLNTADTSTVDRLRKLDEFDLDQLQEAITYDLLNNPEQKKIIEERLDPINLSDLIVSSRVRQRVPIVPGEFEVVFESLTARDEMACKRLIVQESRRLQLNEEYYLQKFSYMGLACAVYSIQNTLLPGYRDSDGSFNEDLFWKKFNMVMDLPMPMLASLGCNYFWFDIRVRKLFEAKRIKNG